MNGLMSLLATLLDPSGAPGVILLIARWSVLLSLAWFTHAALVGRNPRWRVALWRAVTIGMIAVPLLAPVPPLVQWQLPAAARVDDSPTFAATKDRAKNVPGRGFHEISGLDGQGVPVVDSAPEPASDVAASSSLPVHIIRSPGNKQPASSAESLSRVRSWFGVVALGLWAAGVLVLTIRYLLQLGRLGEMIRRSERVADERLAEWSGFLDQPAGRSVVEVRTSAEVHSPCLARSWRPVLLLPENAGSELDPMEMRAILAHELAHARNHDLAWNDVLHLVSIVLWFHPLIWRVRQAHALACDAVCDAVAVDQLGDLASYSRVLARLALRAAGTPRAGALAMARAAVRRRIESLNRRVFRTRLPRCLTLPAALLFGLCVLLIGSLGFTHAGQAASTRGREAPTAGRPVAPEQQEKTAPTALAVGPQGRASTTPLAAALSASGTVVDAGGKPVAGATVILREWSVYRVRGMSSRETEKLIRGEELPDTLAKTMTDASGQFRFDMVRAPGFPQVPEAGKSVFPWDVVALAPGYGLKWVQLTPRYQRTPIPLALGAEGTLRGRLVEPGGQPIAGAKIKVSGIDPLGQPVDNGLGTENRLNLSWSGFPLAAQTDHDGRFLIAGLPRDQIVTLIVTEPGHERLVAFAATTEAPQAENVSRIYRQGRQVETHQSIHTGTFTLTAKRTDHVLSGRVVFEADGKPAYGARVVHGWQNVTTGNDGRYRIEGIRSGPLEVHAIAKDSDAAPLDLTLEIPESPKQIERDLILPRGLLLTGRVVDGRTGHGVEKAIIRFDPKIEDRRTPTIFGFLKATDANGRYRLAVPPGRGTVHLQSVPPSYPPPRRQAIAATAGPFGEAADPQLAEVNGQGGETVEIADFRLSRAPGLVLHVIDPSGRPVPNARVEICDMSRRPINEPGRTDAQGRYEAVGLAPGQVTVLDISADNPPLGTTVEVDTGQSSGEPKTLNVRLEPLVTLSGRVLDEQGRPIAGPVIHLIRDVIYPTQNNRSYGPFVDVRNEVTADGTFIFDRLIPGATYETQVEADGHATATSKRVLIKSGQPVRLDDFRLPTSDQEVRGIVVDPGGKPVAGVTINLDRADRTRVLYAPRGAVWFQDTDASGRFHLTGLPRGSIRLMAYRRPDGADSSIHNMKYVDAPLGQAEVRIELADPNDRLRGIE